MELPGGRDGKLRGIQQGIADGWAKRNEIRLAPKTGSASKSWGRWSTASATSDGTGKKWHFVCASPEVAVPPSIGSSAKEYTRNGNSENNDGEGSISASINKHSDGTITQSPMYVPGEIEKLITLPALSASASEESLRAFASQASVAIAALSSR